jgi:biopolymer transport protein ExbB
MPDVNDPELQEKLDALRLGPQTTEEYLDFFIQVWWDGGWVMIPLFILSLYLYYEAVSVITTLNRTKVKQTPRTVWTKWFYNPSEGRGHIGEVIRYVLAQGMNHDAVLDRIESVRARFIPNINQKITLINVLVTISPLMGLLGTVIGMLTTFKGLAASAGQTVDMVASGISVALITTQTGLMVAIPGYIFISQIIRKRNEYSAFLSQLETLAAQELSKQKNSSSAAA